jgi:rare lipoprotein A
VAIGFVLVLAALLVIDGVRLAFAQTPGGATPVPTAETGIASVYSADLEGQLTASGQRYDGSRLTAAHRTLPLGTLIRVTDPATGRTVSVRVNDRWGGGPGRVVNLSRRAAEELGLGSFGQLTVRVDVEKLGDGRIESPPEDEAVPREALAPRIEGTADNLAGRTRRCENEADILGLRDQWRAAHVRGCLGRKPGRGIP